jgi:hypothetical protein
MSVEQNPDDRELDGFLEGGSPLSNVYRRLARGDSAPPVVDAAILELARQDMQEARHPRWRRSRQLQFLAVAASMTLVVGVLLHLERDPQTQGTLKSGGEPLAVLPPREAPAASPPAAAQKVAPTATERAPEPAPEPIPERKPQAAAAVAVPPQPADPSPLRSIVPEKAAQAVERESHEVERPLAEEARPRAEPAAPAPAPEPAPVEKKKSSSKKEPAPKSSSKKKAEPASTSAPAADLAPTLMRERAVPPAADLPSALGAGAAAMETQAAPAASEAASTPDAQLESIRVLASSDPSAAGASLQIGRAHV